jgi:endonuclease/exonuclease/phosphatase family metal-dependent hydrolase
LQRANPEESTVTQRDDGATVRVATWNVLHGVDLRHGSVDLAAVADTIASWDADLVALQEVDRGLARSGAADQADQIARMLGLHVAFAPALVGDPDTAWRAVGRDDPGGGGYGVALLGRLPLADVARIVLPGAGDGARRPRAGPSRNPGWDREPRVGVRATVEVSGRAVTVATTHLSYLPWRGLRQLRRLLQALDGTELGVVMGDFNLPPWAVALAARGWAGVGGAPTYPAAAPRLQVDQVLVRGAQVTGVRIGAAATSDHLPVIATLRLP